MVTTPLFIIVRGRQAGQRGATVPRLTTVVVRSLANRGGTMHGDQSKT